MPVRKTLADRLEPQLAALASAYQQSMSARQRHLAIGTTLAITALIESRMGTEVDPTAC
jgi:hypothetical protein